MSTRKSTRPRKTKPVEEEPELSSEEEVVKETKKRKAPAKPKAEKPAKVAKGKGKAKADEGEGGEAEVGGKVVATDFSVPKIEDGHIKIASWNVAGFKAVLGKGFAEYVSAESPDIICLQETKIEEEAGLKSKLPDGYHAYFYAAKEKGHHGTGLLTKIKPISVTKGLGIAEHDSEGRCITAEFDKFYLVTTYTPNASRGLVNLDYRVKKWDVDFLKYLKKLEEKKPVIWCGDLNVAHQEIDLKNPKSNKKNAGFTPEERESFTKILSNGFVDVFRHFYPKEEGAYTFWSYLGGARGKDVGWRLDYYIVSESLLPSIKATAIRKHVMGSDHAPIVLVADL
jgi:exodeoxyribonuclease III